jgi:hypothetical protein
MVLENTSFDCSDRGAVLAAIHKSAASKGRIVSSLSLDGENISEESFLASTQGQELHVKTDSIRNLVSESLQEASRYLPVLVAGLGRIADSLEREKVKDAADSFRQASDGIDWLIHVLTHCQNLLGLKDSEILDGKLDEVRNSLNGRLKDVSASLEAGKYFELSFRLRNELIPELEKLVAYTHSLGAFADGRVQ